MPFLVIRDDITRVQVDAIVNPTNHRMIGKGSTDELVHTVAGPELDEECRKIGGCETGDVRVTGGYRLPAKYIIHTVGPVWKDGRHGERLLLTSCYRRALEEAEKLQCNTVAFPLISAGSYGYPAEEAREVAKQVILDFLQNSEMTVYLVLYDREIADGRYRGDLSREIARANDISPRTRFFSIDAARNFLPRRSRRRRPGREPVSEKPGTSEAQNPAIEIDEEAFFDYALKEASLPESSDDAERYLEAAQKAEHSSAQSSFYGSAAAPYARQPAADVPLKEQIQNLDESFSDMVFRKIAERGITDTECYKKANMDRKLFSKIRSNSQYKPSKATVAALAVSLKLSIGETEELMAKAGFALSRSNTFDVIVRFFIERGVYDVYTINEHLYEYDQVLLGNRTA